MCQVLGFQCSRDRAKHSARWRILQAWNVLVRLGDRPYEQATRSWQTPTASWLSQSNTSPRSAPRPRN